MHKINSSLSPWLSTRHCPAIRLGATNVFKPLSNTAFKTNGHQLITSSASHSKYRPCPTAGCCHLTKFTATSQCHSRSITNASQWYLPYCCYSSKHRIETNVATSLQSYAIIQFSSTNSNNPKILTKRTLRERKLRQGQNVIRDSNEICCGFLFCGRESFRRES